jgi:hypothetical protein
MPFVAFALKHKQGPWGDVAMDMRADPQIKRTWGYKRLVKHLLENHRPVERVWCILEEMKVGYEKQREFKGHEYTKEECEFCAEDDVDGHECIPERAHMDG